MEQRVYQFEDIPQEEGVGPIPRRPVKTVREKRLVGVLRNPQSHRNLASGLPKHARDNVILAEPADRAEIPEVLADFARRGIYYLLIDGGDGTIRDVLTAGARIFGDDWPTMVVVPSGKTNALAVDLGMPKRWSLEDALGAIVHGGRIERHPLAIRATEGEARVVQGFIMGAGQFVDAIQLGQTAHRWGAFDSIVVMVTAIWTLLRTLLGGPNDPNREGSKMDIDLDRVDMDMPHAYPDGDGTRFIMLASTLEKFPMGLKPFGKLREGLRLVSIDRPRRRMLLVIPAIAYGYHAKWLERVGFNRCWTDSFTMDIEKPFILDGEAFAPGRYHVGKGPLLRFVTP